MIDLWLFDVGVDARRIRRACRDLRKYTRARVLLRGDVIALRPVTVGDLGEGALLDMAIQRERLTIGDSIDHIGVALAEARRAR